MLPLDSVRSVSPSYFNLGKQFNLEKGSQDSDSQAKAAPGHITQSVRDQGPLIACGSEGCEDFSKFNCFPRFESEDSSLEELVVKRWHLSMEEILNQMRQISQGQCRLEMLPDLVELLCYYSNHREFAVELVGIIDFKGCDETLDSFLINLVRSPLAGIDQILRSFSAISLLKILSQDLDSNIEDEMFAIAIKLASELPQHEFRQSFSSAFLKMANGREITPDIAKVISKVFLGDHVNLAFINGWLNDFDKCSALDMESWKIILNAVIKKIATLLELGMNQFLPFLLFVNAKGLIQDTGMKLYDLFQPKIIYNVGSMLGICSEDLTPCILDLMSNLADLFLRADTLAKKESILGTFLSAHLFYMDFLKGDQTLPLLRKMNIRPQNPSVKELVLGVTLGLISQEKSLVIWKKGGTIEKIAALRLFDSSYFPLIAPNWLTYAKEFSRKFEDEYNFIETMAILTQIPDREIFLHFASKSPFSADLDTITKQALTRTVQKKAPSDKEEILIKQMAYKTSPDLLFKSNFICYLLLTYELSQEMKFFLIKKYLRDVIGSEKLNLTDLCIVLDFLSSDGIPIAPSEFSKIYPKFIEGVLTKPFILNDVWDFSESNYGQVNILFNDFITRYCPSSLFVCPIIHLNWIRACMDIYLEARRRRHQDLKNFLRVQEVLCPIIVSSFNLISESGSPLFHDAKRLIKPLLSKPFSLTKETTPQQFTLKNGKLLG